MIFLNGAGIIDNAMSLIKNNSDPIRAKMLVWLNMTAQKLAVERQWLFLQTGSASVTPASNVLIMPLDFGELKSLKTDSFFLTSKNKLTDIEADQADTSESMTTGYTQGITTVSSVKRAIITLHGEAVTDVVTVKYTIEPPAITDSATDTAWPVKCQSLFNRSLLDFFYEYDMDERAAMSYQLNKSELYDLKKWDNSQKAKPKISRHGYTRGR